MTLALTGRSHRASGFWHAAKTGSLPIEDTFKGCMIRQESSEDICNIRLLNRSAFGRIAEADLVDTLRKHGKLVLSLVAKEHDRVVGHIAFSKIR